MERTVFMSHKIQGGVERLIYCPMLSPRALRSVDACKRCNHHRGVDAISPAQNGMPAQHEVICGLPTRIQVHHRIVEE